jgi:hypothetical protein
MANYHTLVDLRNKLNTLREEGNQQGLSTGFDSLDGFVTLKKGYPLFIAGSPGAGKSEFTFELLLNTSILHGWKHFIYSGEGGSAEDVYADLIFKYIQAPYIKNNSPYAMSEADKTRGEMFINDHFVIANPDLEFTLDDFLKAVKECEYELGITFDTTLFDPFNDIKEELKDHGNREDKYLASVLKQIRISSKVNKRIDIFVNHIADIKAIIDRESNVRYMPPALPNEWSGGRTWWRRAFTMLLIYRPSSSLKDETGRTFEANETHVHVQKSKPKGVGKLGIAKLFWDWKRNRFYSWSGGDKIYSCHKKDPALQNSMSFNQNENNPF